MPTCKKSVRQLSEEKNVDKQKRSAEDQGKIFNFIAVNAVGGNKMKAKMRKFPTVLFVTKEAENDGSVYYIAHTNTEQAATFGEQTVVATYKLIDARDLIARTEWEPPLDTPRLR